MRLRNAVLLLLVLPCLVPHALYSQASTFYEKPYDFPDKIFSRLSATSKHAELLLTKQTEKYLARLMKEELRLQRKLWKKDSTAAKELFGDVHARYAALQHAVASSQAYSGRLDSMHTALRFLKENKLANQSAGVQEKVQKLLSNYSHLQEKLNHAAEIKNYVKERQQYLKEQLGKLGLMKEFKKFQKEVYYYRAQIDEYKRMLEDPSKIEERLLQLANKIPAFKDFFNKHSMLASMFRLPGSESIASAAPIPGLQTRASIQQFMIDRFGSGPNVSSAMQQNVQSAQAQINQLKEKISQPGAGSSDADIPNFKPNPQKVKSFWKRVELGTNVQSVKSNGFFPVTSDIGLSAGYKINDKSVAGIGMSYKLGWGQNIRHIKLTHEGVSFRSFVDVKLKGSVYVSGGFEYNYQQPFNSMQQLRANYNWRESGLIGISKIVSVRSKLFKKTKLQLLWDFLSYQQMPRTQALVFRVGYSLK